MYSKSSSSSKGTPLTQKNTVETLSDLGGSVVSKAAKDVSKIGTGMLDQLLGQYETSEKKYSDKGHEAPRAKRKEGNVFSFNQYHEREVVTREVRALTQEIKRTVDQLKNDSSELVKDASKLALESTGEKPGIYHERFLEVILSLLKALRAKIGESKTWMQALMSKRKKRGSLFAARSKKMGTQYSLSQEMNASRSVQ